MKENPPKNKSLKNILCNSLLIYNKKYGKTNMHLRDLRGVHSGSNHAHCNMFSLKCIINIYVCRHVRKNRLTKL